MRRPSRSGGGLLVLAMVLTGSLWPRCTASPIILQSSADLSVPAPSRKPLCYLPLEYDTNPQISFLEDCQSMERFLTVPMVLTGQGVHTTVCCPKRLDKDSICFPSDAWCPTYVDLAAAVLATATPETAAATKATDVPVTTAANLPPEGDQLPEEGDALENLDLRKSEAEENGVVDEQLNNLEILDPGYEDYPTMAARACSASYNCTSVSRCPNVEDQPNWPVNAAVCGFEPEESQLMICCPEGSVLPEPAAPVPPRFPVNGQARKCEDRNPLCGKWRDHGACELDRHFTVSETDPGNGEVDSFSMFQFMSGACPATCAYCGNKGCKDDHALCPDLARLGACSSDLYGRLMAHTCRESCGVCGFLSPFNTEVQKAPDGRTFSDPEAKDFRCGEVKTLAEINNEGETTVDEASNLIEEATELELRAADDANSKCEKKPVDVDTSDGHFYFDSNATNGEIFCGGTVISDRWIISAAHCYDNFGGVGGVKLNTIRVNSKYTEHIETKRVFKHPLYKYGRAYDDIALVELGRRIVYDYDTFGDTPTCLDLGKNIINKTATVQGFGKTEDGSKGQLLEANVTIIGNEECRDTLNQALLNKTDVKATINRALPFGLNYGLLCTEDKSPLCRNGELVYRTSCAGDSGGPLFFQDDQNRKTLVGIVSGGVDCKNGYPSWYTKVAFFRSWIKCIMSNSLLGDRTDLEIEDLCRKFIREEPKQQALLFDDDVRG